MGLTEGETQAQGPLVGQKVTPEDEKKFMHKELQKQLRDKETWFVISRAWFSLWKEYVDYDSNTDGVCEENRNRPPPIDNRDLFDESTQRLRQFLSEEEHYILVPKDAWDAIKSWYGGGPEIARDVITEGLTSTARVELYPLNLKIVLVALDKDGKPKTPILPYDYGIKQNAQQKNDSRQSQDKPMMEIVISRRANITELKKACWEAVAAYLGIADSTNISNGHASDAKKSKITKNSTKKKLQQQQFKIWKCITEGSNVESIDEASESVDQAGISSAHTILAGFAGGEEKEKPKSKFSLTRAIASFFGGGGNTSDNDSDASNGQSPAVPGSGSGSTANGNIKRRDGLVTGCCGLFNLGNTCFMNSALQCLSNTVPLTEYFLSPEFKNHLNKTNPLGMKGKLATEYGKLMRDMWGGSLSPASPSSLKSVIGQFAPQFNGYSQHDSQELLAFLLDGLHEDTNQIKNKPFVELKESDGRPDDVVAAEAWSNHLLRNKSIIVDIFQGQLKSTVTCPECNKISIIFDPFMYLSLPLSSSTTHIVDVILFKNLDERPVKYTVKLPKQATISDLRIELANLSGINSERLTLADSFDGRIESFIRNSVQVDTLSRNDRTMCYTFPDPADTTKYMRLQAFQRKILASNTFQKYMRSGSVKLFGLPLVLFYPEGSTAKYLYKLVYQMIRRFVKKPADQTEKDNTVSDCGEKSESNETSENLNQPEEFSFDQDFPDGKPFFSISVVSRLGTSCGECNVSSCEGCTVECNDTVLTLKNGQCIGVDWKEECFTTIYDLTESMTINLDTSVQKYHDESNRQANLYDCVKLFTETEKLGVNDTWYCPECKEFRQAYKKFDLFKLPETLVVHLKRFQFNRYWREKINTFVDFPIHDLDLKNFVIDKNQETQYELFAISNHSGGMGGGHYTAYAKNKANSKWYCFNDSSVSLIDESAIKTNGAYVLFYRRKSSQLSLEANATTEGSSANNTADINSDSVASQ